MNDFSFQTTALELKIVTYVDGCMNPRSSDGEFGTRFTIIFLPSVHPIPIDVRDLIEFASVINFVLPPSS